MRDFAQAQRDAMVDLEVETLAGHPPRPPAHPRLAAGAYVPGGRYPMVASAHMTIVTAKVAGVERVAACTPPIDGRDPRRHGRRDAPRRCRRDLPPRRRPGDRGDGARDRDHRPGRLPRRARATRTSPRPSASCSARSGSTSSPARRRSSSSPTRRPTRSSSPSTCSARRSTARTRRPSSSRPRRRSAGRRWRTSTGSCRTCRPRDYAGPAWRDYGQVIVVDDLDEALRARRRLRQRARRDPDGEPARGPRADAQLRRAVPRRGDDRLLRRQGDRHEPHPPDARGARYTGGLWVGKYLKTVTYQEFTDAARASRSASSAAAPAGSSTSRATPAPATSGWRSTPG